MVDLLEQMTLFLKRERKYKKKKKKTSKWHPVEVIDILDEVKSNTGQLPSISREATPQVVLVVANCEVFLRYGNMRERDEVVVDNVFAYTIASKTVNDNKLESQTVEELMLISKWLDKMEKCNSSRVRFTSQM